MNSLNISKDLNYIVHKLNDIPSNEFANLINLIITGFNQNNYQHINLQSWTNKLHMSLQETQDLFGVILTLVRWQQQLRSNSEKEMKNFLMEQGFTENWTNNFFNLVTNRDDKIIKYNFYMPELEKLIWRIDISLYNNTMKRLMSPTIIWNLTLNNGQVFIIEMSLKKFHEIRFNISTLLKEIGILKNNSLVKK